MTTAISSESSVAAIETASKSQTDAQDLLGTTDQFLTILLAQLKHQDPLDPMKGTEFIDSITRLSSVEQSINQSAYLEEMVDLLKGKQENFGSPVSYLDKDVEFNSPAFNFDGEVGEFFYNLEEVPDEVSIVVRDAEGKTVATTNGTTELGRNVLRWDGLDINNNPVEKGVYFVEIAARTGDDATILDSFTSGTVTEASFEDGEVSLIIGGVKALIDQITRIGVKPPVEVASNE